MKRAKDVIEMLDLQPHFEGGWFRQVWKSGVEIFEHQLPKGFSGNRGLASVIYYLLQPGEVSRWHAVRGDEFWLWNSGGTLEIRLSEDAGQTVCQTLRLGDIGKGGGHTAQVHVPPGLWQTARLVDGEYGLASCVVTPAFEQQDYSLPPGETL